MVTIMIMSPSTLKNTSWSAPTLLTFTALTVFLSYVNFGSHKANMAVGMLVATIKAGLVAAIFMHLCTPSGS